MASSLCLDFSGFSMRAAFGDKLIVSFFLRIICAWFMHRQSGALKGNALRE